MNEMNINWDDLRLFLAVARNRGLSGAAKDTGTSAPTLGRRMHDLEVATRKELFRRHARGYDLTEQGDAFFDTALELEAKIRSHIGRRKDNEKTLVKISAGAWTIHTLCQRIADISDAAPDALLRFISADEFLNINHREAVIGIRNQRPHQAGLACRKIGEVTFAGYAVDQSISNWIRVTANTPSAKWLASLSGAEIAMEVNSPQIAKEMALRGMGRVVLPCFIGDKESKLKRVLSPIHELTHEQWLVSHHEDRFIPAVRQVLNSLYDVLQDISKTAENNITR